MSRDPIDTEQDDVLAQLCRASAYPHRTSRIRRIETHISWVYLTGEYAYKVKKAVKLPYLDFSTLAKRERACRDELSLNQRLAPALYRDVVSIGGDGKSVRVGGTPAREFAVRIVQFPDGAIGTELVRRGALSAEDFRAFADDIASFHQNLEPSRTQSAGVRILTNLSELESKAPASRKRPVSAVGAWVRAAIDRLSDRFAERDAAGRIKECHGDLHLGNVVRVEDRLIAFDCLEFSLDLRTIDVIDEVSFLFMDLVAFRRVDLAFAFLNRYLEITGDYDGLRLLRLYATHRALVRAKVEKGDASMHYLRTASALSESATPVCLITHGLSGSGKTTIARSLAPKMEAVHLRSDVERKRRYKIEATERPGAGIEQGLYSRAASETTYRRLGEIAEASLSAGINVLIDAAFLDRHERARFRRLSQKLGASFVILDITAPTNVLRERITERSRRNDDASDADLAVLDHQLQTADAISDDEQEHVVTVATESTIDSSRLAETIRERTVQVSLSSTSS